jgi:hypothetical protein
MFNKSVKNWIPSTFAERELVVQFADSVDWLLSMDYPDSDKLAARFYSVKNKYKSIQDVPLEDIYAIIEEFGYSYITETLDLQEDALRTFLGFLNFIHVNKGTRKGLEFVFRLLDMEYQITEWWEQIPQGEPHTYRLDLLSFTPENVRGGMEVIERIKTFSRNYVYPIISYMLVELRLDSLPLRFCGLFQSTATYTFYPESYNTLLLWDSGQWDVLEWA